MPSRIHPLALLTWAVFVAVLLGGALLAPEEAQVRAALEALGPAAPVAFVVAEAAQVVVIPIPGQPIEIPGGYLFGLVPGIILASTGALVGSLVAFRIGRRYGRPWVESRVAPDVRRRFEGWLESGDRLEWIVFWLMLVPAFPRDPLCYLAGLTGMPARRFALIAAVGRPVGLAPWVALGAQGVASGLTLQLWLLAGAGGAWLLHRGTLRLVRGRRAPDNLPPRRENVMRKLATLKRLFDDRALYCQLIVTRRCNLACAYCNEFDKVSQPVPYEELVRRMDHLVDELGVTIMDFLGGEPLLHPRIADLVAHAKEKGCWTNIITNGMLLSRELIEALNRAGLDSMAVSIDRIHPTEFSHKGLKPLRRKLRALREHARFQVETNTVLCEETFDEFEPLVLALKEMGFPVRCGVRHYDGKLDLNERVAEKLEWFHSHFRHWRIAPMLDLHRARIEGRDPEWTCTGGYKFLYVDEFGTVKACSQVGLERPVNVMEMRVEDLKANDAPKGCEKECGVSCVIQTSLITAQPFRYAARCAQHLLETRGQGAAFGGLVKLSSRRRKADREAEERAGATV